MGGHNGLAAAAYLARAGKSVLVLERRERLGGACTLERPFADQRYVVSPCAYVVGLLDQLVIDELRLADRGPQGVRGRPQPLGAVPRRHLARAVGRRRPHAGRPGGPRRVSDADIKGYWAYEEVFDDMRKLLRTGARDSWLGASPTRDELEELMGRDPWLAEILFEASISDVLDHYLSDQRLKDALFGQG